MNFAAMVDEIGRAVSASVSRSLAPISRQVDELVAWRKAVGEIPSGKDGANGEPGKDGINGKDGAPGKDGEPGKDGKDAPAVDLDAVVAKVLPLIPTPKDGRDGCEGDKGDKGVDGLAGKDGKDGAPGKDGINGRDGANGIGIKSFGYDEVTNTLDIHMDEGDPFTLALPKPQRGEKGEPGINGKDGANGINGKDGAAGIDGKDGIQGMRGEKGDPPSAEEVAAAITKAVESTLPGLISKHIELVMPEIITRASLLVPPGRDGMPGRPGTPGEDGRPGVGIDQVGIEQTDKRTHTLILKMTDGERYEMPVVLDGMLSDEGVHRPGGQYVKGDCVTHGGSYWVAKKETAETPGKSEDWRLVVKRGRDGKDAE